MGAGTVATSRPASGTHSGHQSLKDAGWLGLAAETCATFAGYDQPDYSIDLRGWQPRPTLVEGPGLPGLTGVLQAQHNLLVHLGEFPDARSLSLVLDSQRIVSRDAAAFDPLAETNWSRRASTYLRLIHATNDIGGMVGDGGPAAGEAALATSRIEQFTRAVQAGTETADSGPLRHLAHLGREIDERVTQVIQQGARERIYFSRVPPSTRRQGNGWPREPNAAALRADDRRRVPGPPGPPRSGAQ